MIDFGVFDKSQYKLHFYNPYKICCVYFCKLDVVSITKFYLYKMCRNFLADIADLLQLSTISYHLIYSDFTVSLY